MMFASMNASCMLPLERRKAGAPACRVIAVGAAVLALVLPASEPRAQAAPAPGATAAEASSRAATFVSPIGPGERPPEPWSIALLPRQKKPETRFDVVDLDGQRVLRVRAERSYAALVHAVAPEMAAAQVLRWSARVDTAPDGDLHTKQGDDTALKVCALYDWPRDRLSLGERAKLAAGSALAGQALPTATVCYVVDKGLAEGTWLPNAFTGRIRMLVVQQLAAGAAAPRWVDHRRDLHADFRRAFADEWREGDVVPPLLAVLIGADTDNTASESLAYLRSIDLR
jgi:Protein of unknown function (DUF3047)